MKSISGHVLIGKDAKGNSIGKLSVSQDGNGLDLRAEGLIGSLNDTRVAARYGVKTITVAELLDSDILVGVNTSFAGDLADGAGDFANASARLGSLSVTGKKLPSSASHPAYVMGSHISAPTVGTVTLLNVPASLGAIVHVLNDAGMLKVSRTKLTSGTMFGRGTWKVPGTRPVIWDVV